MSENARPFMKFDEAEKYLEISRATLKRMIANGQLPQPTKLGKRPCFKRDDFFLAIEKMLDPDQATQGA